MFDTFCAYLYKMIHLIDKYLYQKTIRRECTSFPSDLLFDKELFVIGGAKINIGKGCKLGDYCILTAWESFVSDTFSPNISIGNNANIGCYNNITSITSISIGDNFLSGRWVTITDHAHGNGSKAELNIAPFEKRLYSKGEISIGNNVWIGDKVTILGNVRIGDNVVIGANSVVTKSIPCNTIAAGNPCKVIKEIK